MLTSSAPRVGAPSGALLIFDLDGTLYRTETSFLPAVLELFDRHRLSRPDRNEVLSPVGD
jgi:phosphoglycolate phosphatase-like HAD superfamily hydrolase